MSRPKKNDKVIGIDPFDISQHPTEGQKAWANWFVGITSDLSGKYHIRRIHYRTIGKLKPDGTPYQNTRADYVAITNAGEYARYLGMVNFDKIEDHKNMGVCNNAEYQGDWVNAPCAIGSQRLTVSKTELSGIPDFLYGSNFYYDVNRRQPYHIEIWVEKSTLNDILEQIAKRYNAVLVCASGHFSVTNAWEFYERVKNLNKPVRVFYLRDFDPAGQKMCKALSRKLEWFIRNRKSELDVKVCDLALNHEQCIKYKLPRDPLKNKSKKYKKGFEEKYGEGATELDALESLYPGELANIVTEAISPYYDEGLPDSIREFQSKEYDRYCNYKEETVETILEQHKDKLQPMVDRYNSVVQELNDIGNKIESIVCNTEIETNFTPQYPEPSSKKVDDANNPVFLLDTSITYAEQIQRYKAVVS